VLGLSLLAGIGFTVSLLIGGLAYGPGSLRNEHTKVAVLVGSCTAAVLAAVVLRLRNRVYRRIALEEQRDEDGDGVPDCFEPEPAAAVTLDGRRSSHAGDDGPG
jgi:Na+:H+ antiporter, NhaA family